MNKARRTGRREPARDQLRRGVRLAAACAGSVGEFFDLLRTAGVLVNTRDSTVNPGQIAGYCVALPDHTTAAGTPVWYSGGRLAPDLTLPKLRRRRAGTAARPPAPTSSAAAYDEAAEQVRAATKEARRLAGDDPEAAVAAGYAAADTLTVTALPRTAIGHPRSDRGPAAAAHGRGQRAPTPDPGHHRPVRCPSAARVTPPTRPR